MLRSSHETGFTQDIDMRTLRNRYELHTLDRKRERMARRETRGRTLEQVAADVREQRLRFAEEARRDAR